MARNSIHSRRRRRIMISHTSRPCFRAKPAARIATLGWSLALSFVCLLLPARTLPCASFAILYSFPNSSLWQERYGNNDQHRKQRAPDYYDVLGVAKGAGREDVKNAFRRLVKKFHPDANPNHDTTDQFRMISKAYEVLSDPTKRRKYNSQRYHHGCAPDTPNFIIDGLEQYGAPNDQHQPRKSTSNTPVERYRRPVVELEPNNEFNGSLLNNVQDLTKEEDGTYTIRSLDP